MLKGNNLHKSYKSGHVLDNISIAIERGKIYGLLGRNGAGKTTLFKILCGLIKSDSGHVIVESERAKPIGAIIEEPGLYNYLNAYDNLKIFAGIQGAPCNKKALQESLSKVGLPLDRKDPVRNFSMGMKQRLGIAIALLNNPEYLVLDEPFSGLDPIGVASLIQLIRQLANENIGILLSSHLMGELSKSCDYLFVIEQGKIVNQGTTQNLINTHITTYTLSAENIETSIVLKQYHPKMELHGATITCTAQEIPQLLDRLLKEGIAVTACMPQLTLEQLLNTSAHESIT
jgi:ABC-type multidrug transport system ATPase subunit